MIGRERQFQTRWQHFGILGALVAFATAFLLPFHTAQGSSCAETTIAADSQLVEGAPPAFDLGAFAKARAEFEQRLKNGVKTSPEDTLLASVAGRLALLEVSASENGHGLLSLDRILERAEAGDTAAVAARDKLIDIAESLSVGSGVYVERVIPPKLSLKVGVSPRALSKLAEVLYGVSMAASSLASTDAATQKAGVGLFGGLRSRVANTLQRALRTRVESELLSGSLESAFAHLGLLRSNSVLERFAAYRERNAVAIRSLVALSLNIPFMWALGVPFPLYVPKLDLVRSKPLEETSVATSRGLLAEGTPFWLHWQRTRGIYERDFGLRAQVDFGNAWSRRLYTTLLAAVIGHFIATEHILFTNQVRLLMTTHADLVKLDTETFNHRRIRDESFLSWYEAYPKPDSRVTDWLSASIGEGDKERGEQPAVIRQRLETRWRQAVVADPTLVAGSAYVKRYIRQFVTTFHEKSDESLKLR